MWVVRMLKAIFGRDKIVTDQFGLPMLRGSIPMPPAKRPLNPPKSPPPAPSQCGQCVKCKHVIISNDESYPSGGLIICLKTGK